ncbi:serine hydrolase domain-containing protein [Parvularcula marina]|uniref:serine hydrolase domain-containing protein n=1 Tax=Parvularcula marina TaxID=2292771 RepID=UPI003511A08D
MSVKRLLLGGLVAVLALVLWIAWPIYGFFSIGNEAWRLPFGWMEVPDEAPEFSTALDPRYEEAGEAALAAFVARRDTLNLPGYSAAVAVHGEIVWLGGTGWSDIRKDKAVTPDTQYRIGSTSKPVSATLLARLVADGTVNLDTPIGSYAELPNPAWEAMTLRQLSSHTSGLPGYAENTDAIGAYRSARLGRGVPTLDKAITIFDSSDLLFEPGTDFSYSSFDVLLAAYVLTQVTGVPYRELIKRELIDELGLKSLIADDVKSETKAVAYQARRGLPTEVRDEPVIEQVKPWRRVDLSQKLPGGGWVATPSDLVLIGSAWLDEGYLPAAVREDFFTPVRIASGEVNEQDYAVGWRRRVWDVPGVGEVLNLNHGGVSKGSQAWLMVLPEHDMAIAFTTNTITHEFGAFSSVLTDVQAAFIPVAMGVE